MSPKKDLGPFSSSYQQYVTIIQIDDPGIRVDLLRSVDEESLSTKHVIIPASSEIKMTEFGITETKVETVVLLVNKKCLGTLRALLKNLGLQGKETTFSYDSCPRSILKKLGLS